MLQKALKNIYLDIDGVILTKGGTPAEHLDVFLKFVLAKYSVFWLTSRCQGNCKYTTDYLSRYLSHETIQLLRRVKPTSFRLDKTEALDFSKSFFWLDDELFDSEKKTLRDHGRYNSWIEVKLLKNPYQLLDLMNSKFKI